MSMTPYTSRPIRADLVEVLQRLQPGMTIRITQTVRVGSTKTWEHVVTGVYRRTDSLATGLATDRVPADDIIVPIVHFTKESGELSSVSLDERSKIEIVG